MNNKTEKKQEILVSISVDACGMQCPGPIMKLSDSIKKVDDGQTIEIKTTDPAFKMDIESWCNSTGNKLLCVASENKIITAQVQKGTGELKSNLSPKTGNGQTIVLFSNDLDKALAAFIIANGALAAGKNVTLFFTFWGLNILRKANNAKVKKSLLDKMFGFMMPKGANKLILSQMNMLGAGTELMKQVMKNKKVPSLNELIQSAINNGAKIIACNMTMDIMGIKQEELIDGVEIGGVATYIDESSNANNNLFI